MISAIDSGCSTLPAARCHCDASLATSHSEPETRGRVNWLSLLNWRRISGENKERRRSSLLRKEDKMLQGVDMDGRCSTAVTAGTAPSISAHRFARNTAAMRGRHRSAPSKFFTQMRRAVRMTRPETRGAVLRDEVIANVPASWPWDCRAGPKASIIRQVKTTPARRRWLLCNGCRAIFEAVATSLRSTLWRGGIHADSHVKTSWRRSNEACKRRAQAPGR